MGCGNVATMEKENYNNRVSEPDNKEIKIPDNKLKINTGEIKKTDNPKRKKMKEKMKKEMKEYQKLIKRKRKNLNKNGEYDDTSESEDSRLKYAKGKNFAKKRKKLTPEEIEDGIKQDEKEEEKRKNRKHILVQFRKNYRLNTRNQKVHMIQLHQSHIAWDMKMRYIWISIMVNQLGFIIRHGLHMMHQWSQIHMVLEYKYLQDGEFQLWMIIKIYLNI